MTSLATNSCPACQFANVPSANFCMRCGAPMHPPAAGGLQVGTAATSPSPAIPGGSTQARPGSAPGRAASSSAGAAVPRLSSQADSEPDYWLGRLIDGRYRVMARVGQGGMGLVYKVEHQRMGKIAAMKVLHRELAADKEVVKRFRREAEAVSKLTHPNTVQTFDFGTSDGALYLVMEYVRGEDLGALLRRDGAMPFLRAAPLFAQICGALSEAHELGIVHRDLKPENILVTRTKDGADHVKVLDFGLAKLSEREEAADVTGRGSIVGTPYYMSPEQIRGEPLDHRSDIYSLGAMMYRVITGEPPFQAQTPVGVLTKHLTDEVVPPRKRRPDLEIDTRVEAIVLRAMSKRRESRYATVDSMREDVERAREELSAAAQAAGHRPSRGGLAAALPPPGAAAPAAGANGSAISASGAAITPSQIGQAIPQERREEGSSAQPRLKREDFDAFERSLRRRSLLNVVLAPLLLVVVITGVWAWWHWKQAQPRVEEHEPDNELGQATLIATGSPVKGKIGSRLSDREGDKDYYRVRVDGSSASPAKLSITLAPIRNMDLALYVLDRSGRRLVVVDNGGVGVGEKLPNLSVTDSIVYVAVQESREGGDGDQTPTENVTDEYTLTVEGGRFADDEEREPDEADSDATAIGVGKPMRGTFARWRDSDKWRFDGDPGTYSIEVTGGDGLPVTMRLGNGTSTKTRKLDPAALSAGEIITVERADADAPPEQRKPLMSSDVEYQLTVRKK